MDEELIIWDHTDPREYLERVRKGVPPLIICVAVTGGLQGKEINPNHPETPEEIAEHTYEAYKAGASIVHIHARRRDNPTLVSYDPEAYREINALIREKCPDMIINNTTGGGIGLTMEQRMASLNANPEMASLNCGPLAVKVKAKARKPPLTGRPEDIVLDIATPITFGETELYARTMLKKGIKPELEVYHLGQYWLVDNLINQGLLEKPYFIQFVMGFQSGIPATPKNLISMIEGLPPDSIFQVIGVGWHQLPMNVMAILLGGHIRTGMEDNVYYQRGEFCKNNAQLVERVVRLAKELGREVATPKETRRMLGISEKPSQY